MPSDLFRWETREQGQRRPAPRRRRRANLREKPAAVRVIEEFVLDESLAAEALKLLLLRGAA